MAAVLNSGSPPMIPLADCPAVTGARVGEIRAVALGVGLGVWVGIGELVGTGIGVAVAALPHATATRPRIVNKANRVFRRNRMKVFIHTSRPIFPPEF